MAEENEKKECPFCGEKINKDAKKCRFCGNWIDEEILCPYCAEKIKASAKKCRYCGEWLNKENKSQKEKINPFKKYFDKNFLNIAKNKLIILSSIGLIFIIIITIIACTMHIPSCDNSNIQSKLKEHLISNYKNIEDITLDKTSVHKLKRLEKGYSCSINAAIEGTPTTIEYNYKKVALNEYNLEAKFVLPNCFDLTVKDMLNNLIKDANLYNIKNNTMDVETKYEKQDDYDKDSISYKCSAETILTAKPGKAYLLSPWDYDIATRKIKCKINYKSYFCENGYTTCVGLIDLYDCEYEED